MLTVPQPEGSACCAFSEPPPSPVSLDLRLFGAVGGFDLVTFALKVTEDPTLFWKTTAFPAFPFFLSFTITRPHIMPNNPHRKELQPCKAQSCLTRPPDHPTTRPPDHPTTRPPDQKATQRLPYAYGKR